MKFKNQPFFPTVFFGYFEAEYDVKGKTGLNVPMEWIVLEQKEDRELLLSKIVSSGESEKDDEIEITYDHVFLLSVEKVKKYFCSEKSARTEILYLSKDEETRRPYTHMLRLIMEPWSWWTMTVGPDDCSVYAVEFNGRIEDCEPGASEIGVRPAIWVRRRK